MENALEWETMTIKKPDGTSVTTNDYERILQYLMENIAKHETLLAIRRNLEKRSVFHPNDLQNNEGDDYMCRLTMEMFSQIGLEGKELLMSKLHDAIEQKADGIMSLYCSDFNRYMKEENRKLKNPFDRLILKEIRKAVESLSKSQDLDYEAVTKEAFSQLADPIRKILSFNSYQTEKITVAEAVNIYRHKIDEIVNPMTETEELQKLCRIKTESGETVELTTQDVMMLYDNLRDKGYKEDIEYYLRDDLEYLLDETIEEEEVNPFIEKIMQTFGADLITAYARLILKYGDYDDIFYDAFRDFKCPIHGLLVKFRKESALKEAE